MMLCDYHVHTNYCDGRDAPEEIVRHAIRLGLKELGLVVHSYTHFDTSFCVPRERIRDFQCELSALKEKYAGMISLRCGVEQDYYANAPTDGFDYVIAALHYVKCGDAYFSVDESREKLCTLVSEQFAGDYYAFADAYYTTLARLGERMRPDIIAHFDLITKFNEHGCLFDESDERYRRSAGRALEALSALGVPFEINTGAIARGYRSTPYPSAALIGRMRAGGCKLILSGDSHQKETLCYAFEKWEHLTQ